MDDRYALVIPGPETRAKLITAAIELIGEYGLSAVRSRDVSDRAEVNVSAVVYHFGSIDRLYAVAAEVISRELGGKFCYIIDRINESRAGLEAKHHIHRILEEFLSHLSEWPYPVSWKLFLFRCERARDTAFNTIYDATFEIVAKEVKTIIALEAPQKRANLLRQSTAALFLMSHFWAFGNMTDRLNSSMSYEDVESGENAMGLIREVIL